MTLAVLTGRACRDIRTVVETIIIVHEKYYTFDPNL